MISLVGAYRGAGDCHRGAERDAVLAVSVKARRDKVHERVAAGERGHDEGLGLALLPGEIGRGDDIEGHVRDMKEAPPACVPAWVPECGQTQIVGLIKTRERIGIAAGCGALSM